MSDFHQQCKDILAKFKNNCAVCYWDETNSAKTLTYLEVFDISINITNNIKPIILEDNRTCIALYMKKNLYIPSLILSLQECNCAFMFLDPQESESVNSSICQRLNLKWIVSYCEETHSNSLLSTNCNKVASFLNLVLWKNNIVEQKCVDYQNILYVICTSGTTGRSKTVKVTENCIMPNINALRIKFNLTEDDVIYFGTPLTFDPFIVELFLTLTTGCTIVIPPNKKLSLMNIEVLFPKNGIHRGVTVLQTVPSLFAKWNEADKEFLLQKSSCRILAFGGEKFPDYIVTLPRSKNLRLFNLYGITEVSCWSSINEVTKNDEVGLGQALPETLLEVRDACGTKITEGEGELYIGSDFRICYINEETENLIKPVFRATGDLVQVKNSELIYVGRTNGVIKRLGHKVNLVKIQQAVLNSTNICNACIWIERLKKLVLFVVIKEYDLSRKKKIVDKLRIKLLQILSQEYYPDHIEIVPSLPTTAHGKLDVNTLESIYQRLINCDKNQNAIDIFQLLWCKYLGLSVDAVTVYFDHNFIDLGGNSISVIQCLSEFKERIGNDYPKQLNVLLFENTLKDCCECIKDIGIKVFRKRNYDGTSCNLQITSLDTVEMNIKWKHCLEACVDSSPVVVNGRYVAVGSFSHIFVILDCVTGNVATQIYLPDAIESACCVSLCNKYVYTGCYDGNMYCIEVSNGNIIWKYSTSDRIKCTPCIVMQNNSIIFGSYDKHLHCVDFNTGNAVWKSNLSGSVTSNPLVREEFVYVATILGLCFCICCLNGNIIWRHDVGIPIFGGGCLVSNYDYIMWIDVNGSLHAFSCNNGSMCWSFKIDGNVYSSVININNLVLFGSSNSKLYCIEVQEHSGKLKQAITLDSPISSACNIFKHENEYYCLVAINTGIIYMIDYNEGVVLGRLNLPGEVFSSPIVVDTKIYVGCRDNNVYCIEFKFKEIKR